jgi:hypothetical protein
MLLATFLLVLRGRPVSEEFKPADNYRVEIRNFWPIRQAIERVRALLAEHP